MEIETIVVIDSDATNRARARAALESDGFHVIAPSDGLAGMAAVEREAPACVLLDLGVPRVDAREACARIHAMPHCDETAIILTSAQRDLGTFDRAVSAGADDFVTKPFDREDLAIRVRQAIRVRRSATSRPELLEVLTQQRARLQRAELHREQMVEFLVHDLKNPVNAIALHARLIRQKTDDVERTLRSLASIEDETHALLRMISNLLDISKADEERLAPAVRRVDADAFVRSVVDELRPRVAAAGIRVALQIEAPYIEVDPDLIGRVIANLLDNAIRFAPEGSAVRITIMPTHDGIELSVADTGPGIPESLRPHAFERFQRGQDRTDRLNRGLGLTFCKLAVETHNGQIWIEDGSPGAVFRVHLPSSHPGVDEDPVPPAGARRSSMG